MYKIDKIDREIIRLLMVDGRMSCADIARSLGNTSERSIRYRLDRLIKDRFIKISAVTNPTAFGYDVRADVFIEVEPGLVQQVARKLVKYEIVSYLACSIGDRDISLQVVGHSNTEIYSFVTEVIGKVPGVRKTTTSIVPVILKDVYDWHIPDSAVNEEKQSNP